ncbi:Rhotekin [Schistosoma japonicum]|uniref:Rhotekin n=1 Tax=Schistosoma japonicum TaxID=6182 RepID=A0A4Z2DLD1_SCHJA|nr:Rhotekin [Schistosoma japonicum]
MSHLSWNLHRKCFKVPKLNLSDPTLPPLPPSKIKCADPKLQQDLERYYKIRAAACRILSIAQNPLQRLDAAKTLLVSHAQLLNCMRLIQREKVEDARHANKTSPHALLNESSYLNGTILRKPCFAKPGYVHIRIPLIWRNVTPGTNMHLAMQQLFPSSSIVYGLLPAVVNASGENVDKSDSGEYCDGYSLFCTIQVGHVIRDTRLIFDIKPGTADIEINDKWTFDDVTSEFECIIEIYAFPKGGPKSNSMFSKRRFTQSMNQQRKFQIKSQYFDLIGRCVATLKDVQNKVSSHTLEIVSNQLVNSGEYRKPLISTTNSSTSQRNFLFNDHQSNETPEICDLPLFGNICYRLIAQPHSAKLPLKSGYLWIRKLTPLPVQTPMLLYHCELRNRYLWATLINTNYDGNNSYEFSSLERDDKSSKCCEDFQSGSHSNSNGMNSKNLNQDKESHHGNCHLGNPATSLATDCSPRNTSNCYNQTLINGSFSPETSRNPSSHRCYPDLIIPIHTETNFLDSQLILRQTELTRFQRTADSLNTSQNNFDKSNKCCLPSPKDNRFHSNPKSHHPDVNYISCIDSKRGFSTMDISCLSNSPSYNDHSFTLSSFFSPNKNRLLNYQSVDNILNLSTTEHTVHLRDKPNKLGSQSSNNLLKQSDMPLDTKLNDLSPSVDKVKSASKSSLSPVIRNSHKCLFGPVDARKRHNRVSRSVEPVRRIFPKLTTTFNVDTSSLLDLSDYKKLKYFTPQSSKASSFNSVSDPVKDNDSHQSCVFTSELLTFRIATCHLDENVYSAKHHNPELRQNGSSVEVFEFTATQIVENDSNQLFKSSSIFESDEKEILAWFSSMKQHVKEQEIWGSEAFSENINIPKQKSNSIRSTSARRSIAIPNDSSVLSY